MSGIINSVGARGGIIDSDVYPAGHIIQVASNESNALATMTGDTIAIATNCTCGITNVTAGNHVFIMGQYTYDLRAGANSSYAASLQYIYHSTTSGGTFEVVENAGANNRMGVLNMDDDDSIVGRTRAGSISFSFLDEDPGAGEHHYKIFATSAGGASGGYSIVYIPQNTSSTAVMTLMEIQA